MNKTNISAPDKIQLNKRLLEKIPTKIRMIKSKASKISYMYDSNYISVFI